MCVESTECRGSVLWSHFRPGNNLRFDRRPSALCRPVRLPARWPRWSVWNQGDVFVWIRSCCLDQSSLLAPSLWVCASMCYITMVCLQICATVYSSAPCILYQCLYFCKARHYSCSCYSV